MLSNVRLVALIAPLMAGLWFGECQVRAQSAMLPVPSGKHPAGKASFHWVESKPLGNEVASADARREVLVQVWYPATGPSRSRAVYLPGAEALASSPAAAALANLFGPTWRSITSNEVQAHAFDQAPVARGKKMPVLVFSSGGGVPVAAYTAQMEDLASHGYMVAGINHIFDLPGVALPDGRLLMPQPAPPQSGSADSIEKKRADMRAADIRFVVDQLQNLNADANSIFRARLELARLGVFGHSVGGRSAARACQLDARIKACLNQDGNMGWQPFWLDESGNSMRQPYMTLDHLDADPPEEVFSKMGTTREQYVARRSARQAEARKKLYETVAGGSYHVTIRTPGVSHNSFLDVRQLGRPDGPGINSWPDDVRAATPNAQILKVISTWTRAFFDKTIRQDPKLLFGLERAQDGNVEVRRYGSTSK